MAISGLIEFENHTLNHVLLNKCTYKKIIDEINISSKKIEQWTGKKPKAFAYPNGNIDERAVDLLKNNGIRIAASTEKKNIDVMNIEPYKVPRIGIPNNCSMNEVLCRIIGVW
jgi:peptidoglycan/xylan/chitin deacetylase (PgdA/CDA1 family)